MGLVDSSHVYSYSQLSLYNTCPYSFYLDHIEKENKISNGFAEQGTLIHDLIDMWASGLIDKDDLPKEYERRYPEEVVTRFPRMLASKGYSEKTYNQGLEYFKNFDCFNGYTIISTEKKYETYICDRKFVGIVDMIMRDNKTGDLIILDHKSKSQSAFKKEENDMYKQQYLYSKFVYEAMNEYPKRLMFNLFKENGIRPERLFSMEEYNHSLEWAANTIQKIENNDIFDWFETKTKDKSKDFFCSELCSVRKSCTN